MKICRFYLSNDYLAISDMHGIEISAHLHYDAILFQSVNTRN